MKWGSTEGRDVPHRPLTPWKPTSLIPAGGFSPGPGTTQLTRHHNLAKEMPPQPRTLTRLPRTYVQNNPSTPILPASRTLLCFVLRTCLWLITVCVYVLWFFYYSGVNLILLAQLLTFSLVKVDKTHYLFTSNKSRVFHMLFPIMRLFALEDESLYL